MQKSDRRTQSGEVRRDAATEGRSERPARSKREVEHRRLPVDDQLQAHRRGLRPQ